MSQKDGNFQSKARRGGQKFGGFKSGGRGRGRPEGRSFGERSEGDRAPRPYNRDARPPRRDRDSRSDNRSEGQGEYKPQGFTPSDSRPPRREFGDKPYKKREFGDKPYKKREFGDKRGFGDKPYKKREFGQKRDFSSRDDKPEGRARDFDSRPPRDEARREYKPRESGDKPYKKREFGDKRGFGDKKPYNKEKSFDKEKRFDKFDSRPQKSFERYEENRPEARQKLKSDRPSYGAPSSAYLYGIHAVSQALLNQKRLHQRLLCTQKGFESLQETWTEAQGLGIALPQVTTVEKEDLERLLPRDAVHQDVLLDCQPLTDILLLDLISSVPDDAKILVLDQVTDPHNVGAILRSAAAFGAIAVVMQKLHAPDITGTLAKAASGAVEHVPLVREVNLSRALEQLKEAGFFCIGLDEEGKRPLSALNLTGKTALVLGAEGSGLRRLVAENCDELAKLPTQGAIGSLNVSNAAAVALYELIRTA